MLKNRVENKKLIASLFSEYFHNEEVTYELNEILKLENKLNRDYLIYKTGNKKTKKFKQ